MFPTPAIETIPVPADFQGFDPALCDPSLTKETYRRNLPHWRHEGGTYFTTFRLNDSVPAAAANEMKREALLMQAEVERERRAAGGLLSLTTARKWEDFQKRRFRKLEAIMDAGHGQCVLRDIKLRRLMVASLLHFENVRCRMSAFVIMPNHVHALFRPLSGFTVEDLAGSWKKHCAATINMYLQQSGKLWQRETYDRIVRDGTHFRRIVRYIIRNPAAARLHETEATIWLSDEIRNANEAPAQ